MGMHITTSRPRGRAGTAPRRLSPGHTVRYVFLIVVAVLFVFPLAWMIVSSFKQSADLATTPLSVDPRTLSLDNYTSLLAAVPLWVGFKNTARLTLRPA